MQKLLSLTLICLFTLGSVFAQGTPDNANAQARAENHAMKMQLLLDLDEKQVEQLKAIDTATGAKIKTKREEMKALREENREEVKAIKNSRDKEVMAMLTPEQQEKYKQWVELQKQQRAQKMEHRKAKHSKQN